MAGILIDELSMDCVNARCSGKMYCYKWSAKRTDDKGDVWRTFTCKKCKLTYELTWDHTSPIPPVQFSAN